MRKLQSSLKAAHSVVRPAGSVTVFITLLSYLCMAFKAIRSLVLVYLSNRCCSRQSELTCSPCLLPPYLFMLPYCPQLLSDHFSFPVSPFISPFFSSWWVCLDLLIFFSFVCAYTCVCHPYMQRSEDNLESVLFILHVNSRG